MACSAVVRSSPQHHLLAFRPARPIFVARRHASPTQFSIYRPNARRGLKITAMQGGGGSGGPGKSSPSRRELELLLQLIVQYPAVRGSMAVAIGYFAHVDPLGTLSYSPLAATIGVLFMLPTLLLELVCILPSWEAETVATTQTLMVPRGLAERIKRVEALRLKPEEGAAAAPADGENGARLAAMATATTAAAAALLSPTTTAGEAASTNSTDTPAAAAPRIEAKSATDEELVAVDRVVMVRNDQHPLRNALYAIQTGRVMNNMGKVMSLPTETGLMVLLHVAEEMLYRGVLLTLVVRWCTDNLYFAGVEEELALPKALGGAVLAVPQLGAVIGAAGLTAVAVGLTVQRQLFPLRLIEAAKRQLEKASASGKQGTGDAAAAAGKGEQDSKADRAKARLGVPILTQVQAGIEEQQRWTVAIEAAIEFSTWVTLSSSYLMTGNLLAPIAGSFVNDFVYSAFQRLKYREVQKGIEEQWGRKAERMKQSKELLEAVTQFRKEKLNAAREETEAAAVGGEKEGEKDGEEEKGVKEDLPL